MRSLSYTGIFAIQYRLDLVPTAVPLNFTEMITDKFRLFQVRERKAALAKARILLTNNKDPIAAIRILESTSSLGEDREVESVLAAAYRAAGQPDRAENVELRRRKFLGASCRRI